MAEFVGKVLGAELIRKRLRRLGSRTRAGVPRDMDLISADLLERAANVAPILTGDLIRSGRVSRTDTSEVSKRLVTFGTDHAVFTHESFYNLGPISVQKPSTEDGPVGRKYLERPFRRNSDRYVAFLQDSQDKRNREIRKA